MADEEQKPTTEEKLAEDQTPEEPETASTQEIVTETEDNVAGERDDAQSQVDETLTKQETVEEVKEEAEPKKDEKEDTKSKGDDLKAEKKDDDKNEKKKDDDIKSEENATGGNETPPITTINDKDGAIFSHNAVRRLHSSDALTWDDDLAKGAEEWAKDLAENDSGLKHSPDINGKYGESLYISKGASNSARTYQAALCWYKTAKSYNFNSPGYTSATAAFTQLIWQDTKTFGVGIAYCEERKTTYIVARYSPPGNARHAQKYSINVKAPTDGRLPPRVPKLEDLMPVGDDEKPLSNMGNLFEVLCHWCISDGEKATESHSGIQNMTKDSDSESKKETENTASTKSEESTKNIKEIKDVVTDATDAQEETKQQEDMKDDASKKN